MVRAGQRPPPDGVPVHVPVAGEAAQPLQVLLVEHLAAVDGPVGVRERLGHPVVHAQVEVGEDEDRGLEAFGHVEGLHGEREALLHRAGQEQDLLGVAVGEERRRDDVALCGAGGQPGGGPDPLDVEDHAGDLGVVAQAGQLGHERDARAARGGHGPRTGPARSQHHAHGGELVLGLHHRVGGLPVRPVPVLGQVAGERLDQRRRRA